MNGPYLQTVFDWVAAHPHWAGGAVFLVALTESLAVVGLFVPGTVLMLGIGALVAFGALDFASTWAWAAAGAMVGDGISYWLGRHFRDHLREYWPLRTHPGALARSERFFQRHGGKGVFLGRFVGPIRPVIPAVAGMVAMPVGRFAAVNVASAALWAPAYLLPGMAVGASLALAAEVATQLAAVLVALALAVFGVLWLLRRTLSCVQDHGTHMIDAVGAWARRRPRLGRLALGLIDPHHPEFRALAVLALVLLAATWAFFGLLVHTVGGQGPGPVDAAVYEALRALRTPRADPLMVAVTQLGGARVYIPLTLAVLAFLLVARRPLAALHWVAGVVFGLIATQALKWLVGAPRPAMLFEGPSAFAFPSGHTSMSTVVYGFLAVLIARELAPARRWIPYAAAAVLVTPIAFSRLYLGAHWLSDVAGGAALGLAWVALLGIAYRHHAVVPLSWRGLAGVALATLVAAGSWEIARHLPRELARYAVQADTQVLDEAAWWATEWRRLPAWRRDLWPGARRPLTVQWAGELDRLQAMLVERSWRAPPAADPTDFLAMVSPKTELAQLAVFPRVHAGHYEALALTRSSKAPGEREVLRLWPTSVRLGESRTPVWVGALTHQRRRRLIGLVSYPRTLPGHTEAATQLRRELTGSGLETAIRQRDGHPVLLLRPAGS